MLILRRLNQRFYVLFIGKDICIFSHFKPFRLYQIDIHISFSKITNPNEDESSWAWTSKFETTVNVLKICLRVSIVTVDFETAMRSA